MDKQKLIYAGIALGSAFVGSIASAIFAAPSDIEILDKCANIPAQDLKDAARKTVEQINAVNKDATVDLANFFEQSPRFESANYYGAPEAYRQDYRRAYRDLIDCRAFVSFFSGSDKFDDLLCDVLTCGDRLKYDADGKLEYTTGQYWCTEYRAASLEALRRAAWRYYASYVTFLRRSFISATVWKWC